MRGTRGLARGSGTSARAGGRAPSRFRSLCRDPRGVVRFADTQLFGGGAGRVCEFVPEEGNSFRTFFTEVSDLSEY